MISETEAAEIARSYVEEMGHSVYGGVAIIDVLTKPYGWIFFYNSKRYIETKDPLDALGGNGPFVVLRADGAIYQLGSAREPEVYIYEFELKFGLRL